LAETIFHELAHQRLFVSGDTDFNEAFATVVGREGARRWLRVRGDTREFEDWEGTLDLEDRHVALALRARKELEQLYASRVGLQGKWTGAEELRERKRAILEKMCRDQAALRGLAVEEAWSSGGRPCDWNNARLNSVATYYELVPAFEALFAAKDHDFAAFYQAVEALADLDSHQRLEALTAVTSDRLAAE
jgi:predicted aminopeptidase